MVKMNWALIAPEAIGHLVAYRLTAKSKEPLSFAGAPYRRRVERSGLFGGLLGGLFAATNFLRCLLATGSFLRCLFGGRLLGGLLRCFLCSFLGRSLLRSFLGRSLLRCFLRCLLRCFL